MNTSINRHYYKHNLLQQLRGFCYAVQTGSISRAAEKMFLSQPSVSLQIQALERELGVTLFERRGPKIRLTPEGQTLYEMALPLLEGLDNLPETFMARRDSIETGELNITAGEATILYLLPDIVKRFCAAHPGIRVRFHNVPGREGLRLMRDDAVDFAVGSFRDVPDDITYQPIYAFDQMLITPTEHPLANKPDITLADISGYEFILPPRGLNTLSMVELAFQEQGLSLNVRLEAGGWAVIKHYVEMGLGISIVSGICITPEDRVAAHSLNRYFPRRTYGVVMRRGKFLTPQAKRFIEFIDPNFFILDQTFGEGG
ncbi:LysR family transcriptional regulator [Plasticicumulans acidivorans]|uniref:DNA-binding transcriptional LysR family regulator n=1 Tax=Plasticicumulans acidivorans TaxID=886464 RepID=A0A317N0U6_9GAMM|nr:LysR family transcriptional regulator [Plasticicumulans acidivorans]PWV65754.1 DNA-binding transcriptional LysR family regulator [Plasticicumulans acidivorans]